jgi:hypothetical protein
MNAGIPASQASAAMRRSRRLHNLRHGLDGARLEQGQRGIAIRQADK